MAKRKTNPHMGSSLESFLEEEGMLESATAKAAKAVLAWQIEQHRKRSGMTKTHLARMLNTSRAQLNRVLDPNNEKVTLAMLGRIADVLGRKLVVEFR